MEKYVWRETFSLISQWIKIQIQRLLNISFTRIYYHCSFRTLSFLFTNFFRFSALNKHKRPRTHTYIHASIYLYTCTTFAPMIRLQLSILYKMSLKNWCKSKDIEFNSFSSRNSIGFSFFGDITIQTSNHQI